MLRKEIKTYFSENARKNETRDEVPKGENAHTLRGADILIAMHTSVLSSSYAWMIFPEQSESAGASNCPSEVSSACNSDSSHSQLSARQNPNFTEH